MKKILILSGKGGTGKTTVASSFINLLDSKSYADCDVDAPNLHITVNAEGSMKKNNILGLPKAFINTSNCINCNMCIEKCRFNAISYNSNNIYVDVHSCEGCGLCSLVCPQSAIEMKEYVNGITYVYEGKSTFSTAKLVMGEGSSGKIVSEVKKNMKILEGENDIAIIDGSPGIGCPVIASISGVDMVLIVTEPSISGISDLKRIIKTVKVFRTKYAVCINKYDLNDTYTEKIYDYCKKENIEVVGKIPFDKEVISAVNQGKSIVETNSYMRELLSDILSKTINCFMDINK